MAELLMASLCKGLPKMHFALVQSKQGILSAVTLLPGETWRVLLDVGHQSSRASSHILKLENSSHQACAAG